jgi:predicted deacylase
LNKKRCLKTYFSYKRSSNTVLMLFSVIAILFFVIPGCYATDSNSTNSSVYTQSISTYASTATSNYTISILDNTVGGNVLANPEISQNIPRTDLSNQIFNMTKQGSVVLKFGDGNGPKLLILAGIHGSEEEPNIAVMKFLEYIKDQSFNGTLYVIPFSIPCDTAINQRDYKGQDPNRIANISGTPGWKIVKFAQTEGINYLLDVHSGSGVYHEGLIYINSPQTRTTEENNWVSYIKSQTGCYNMVNSADSMGMIRTFANSIGINSITLEVEVDTIPTMTAAETEFKMIKAAAQYLGFIGNTPTPASSVTMSQLSSAAATVKSFYESNKVLPSSVTINNQSISMSSFLYLLATATLQANSNSTGLIALKTVDPATSPSGTIKTGNIYKSEFVSLSQNILSCISINNRAPDYVTCSLGNMSFTNTIYLYTKIMNYYKTYIRLPNYVSMVASGSTPPPNPTPSTVTLSQVVSAASTVKSYYESNNALPGSVTISGQNVSMYCLLYLLTTATLQVNTGSTSAITLKTVNPSTYPSGTIKSGSITKSEFITIAQTILTYISTNNRTPDYVTCSLGNMSFSKTVYMYSKITNYYKTYNRLPNYVSM